MKRRSVIAVVVTLIAIPCLLFVGAFVFLRVNADKNGTIIVNNKCITDVNIIRDPMGVTLILPFSATMEQFGYEVTDIDEDTKLITNDEHSFELNMKIPMSLKKNGHKVNDFLLIPPGSYDRFYYEEDNDLWMDVQTLNETLDVMESEYRLINIRSLKAVIFY